MKGAPSPAYYIEANHFIALQILALQAASIGAKFRVVYEDGSQDVMTVDEVSIATGLTTVYTEKPAKARGLVVGGFVYTAGGGNAPTPGSFYVSIYVVVEVGGSSLSPQTIVDLIGTGWVENLRAPTVGNFDPYTEYAEYVFVGNVAEDATAGTHVVTLTITPGAGTIIESIAGQITVGATATAQTASVRVDDGTNNVYYLMNPAVVSNTSSGEIYGFPQAGDQTAAILTTDVDFTAVFPFRLQGTMRLILQVSTAAVSVTQTFSVALKLKGGLPTVALADSVGTPVLTTTTSKVF